MKFPITGNLASRIFQPLEILAVAGLLFLITSLASRATSSPAATPLGSVSAALQSPSRVAIDSSGRVFVSDSAACRIAIFDAFGRLLQIKDGFAAPLGIAIDSAGKIFVAESQAGRVRIFDSQWNPLGKLGGGDGEFQLPNFIAADPSPGSTVVFVSDSKANQIRAYTNGVLAFAFGTQGANAGQFDFPAGIFATTNELYVVDQINDRVQVFDHAGTYLREFTLVAHLAPGMFGNLGGRSQGIVGDAAGRIYVADAFQCLVRIFDTQGTFLGKIGEIGDGTGQFRSPDGIALDPFNRLFIASRNNRRVEIFGIDSYFHLISSVRGKYAPAGTNLLMNVISSGGSFSCQWRRDGTNLVDGGTISGAQTASLSITQLETGDSGLYSVIASGTQGTFAVSADPLVVLVPPSIVMPPVGQIVPQGATVVFDVAALGDAISFQWMHGASPMPGATNTSITISSAQPGDSGPYSVNIQNAVGQIASDAAALSVITPPVIVHHPTDMTVIEGDTANFFSLAQGDGVSYQWKFNGGDLPAANFSVVQIANAQPAAAGNYFVIASNIAGAATSSVANLSILVPPSVNAVGSAITLPDGTVQLSLLGIDGYAYAIDSSLDLETWIRLSNIATTSGVATIIDMNAAGQSKQFYRLRWKP
jgi:sugar lactone lactonase YvrE